MVYKIKYSPDGTLANYTQFTLSHFNPDDFEYRQHREGDNSTVATTVVEDLTGQGLEGGDPEFCRYHDYRYPPWGEAETR